MSIRTALFTGLVMASLALGGGVRAEEATRPPADPASDAPACAHHMKAMHGMSTDKEREAYCHAHKDCMSHHCGGMGTKRGDPMHVDPPAPPPKVQPPKP